MNEGDNSNDKGFDLESILEVLDDIEKGIEAFKKKAESLAEEKSHLESTLGIILNDFKDKEDVDSEEVVVKTQRLSQRLDGAAKIYIEVPRDAPQKEAMKKMESLLAPLEKMSMDQVSRYLNSTSGKDPSDQKFERVFHACSVDDQKFVKSKLERRLSELNLKSKD